MSYTGKIQNGVVVLDDKRADLPEGTVVRVDLVPQAVVQPDDESVPTLYEQLEAVIGAATELPADMAANHDHYLHGRPRK